MLNGVLATYRDLQLDIEYIRALSKTAREAPRRVVRAASA